MTDKKIYEGDTTRIRFTLQDRETGDPVTDAEVLYRIEGPEGFLRERVEASHVGEGVYQASVNVGQNGTYTVSVTAENSGGDRRSDEKEFVVWRLRGRG